jgi:hypothetical protein
VHARTGYLPGDVRLWPRLTAREVAGHLARLRGLDHDRDTVDLAKRLDVDLDRPVRELSKGNRQKADEHDVQVVATIRTRSFTQLQRVVLRSTSHGSVFLSGNFGAVHWSASWLPVAPRHGGTDG